MCWTLDIIATSLANRASFLAISSGVSPLLTILTATVWFLYLGKSNHLSNQTNKKSHTHIKKMHWICNTKSEIRQSCDFQLCSNPIHQPQTPRNRILKSSIIRALADRNWERERGVRGLRLRVWVIYIISIMFEKIQSYRRSETKSGLLCRPEKN